MSRVLIVDDVPLGIKLLGELLSGEYEVMVATNGRKALEIAKNHDPELILLDVVMPEMDGFETCRRLKEDPQTADIPVIFVTAMSETEDIVRGFEVGGQDYILKPFRKNEVLARVKTHIELRKAKKLLVQYAQELEKKNEELQYLLSKMECMAMTDYLTGLYNRRKAIELMNNEVARSRRGGKPLCVLMLDIDDFKKVNDSLGHEAGDYVLKEVAALLTANKRNYDILARWGGEEFILLLCETNIEEGLSMAERIRHAVCTRQLTYQGRSFSISVTIGIAEMSPEDDLEQVIRKADAAMYQGKQMGKNRVVPAEG